MSALFTFPAQRALDDSGDVMSGAKLYFYETGTTTLKTVYQDADLNTEHTNPVTADAYGEFSPIWLDSSAGNYTVVLKDSAGVQQWSADDVSDPGTTLDAASLLALLLTVDGAGTTLDADTVDGYEASAFARLGAAANFTAGLQVGGIDVGFKGLPVVAAASGGTATTSWIGKAACIGAGSTLPASVFAAGDVFAYFNTTASTLSITRGSGLTLYYNGVNSASVSLPAYSMMGVWFYSATVAVIK